MCHGCIILYNVAKEDPREQVTFSKHLEGKGANHKNIQGTNIPDRGNRKFYSPEVGVLPVCSSVHCTWN